VTAILSWIFAERVSVCGNADKLPRSHDYNRTAEFVTVTARTGRNGAVATLTLIPSLIFVTIAQRYIVMGLTFGAVKE
jgi:multiple sugar transport system permease protein